MNLMIFLFCFIILAEAQGSSIPKAEVPLSAPESAPPAGQYFDADGVQQQAEQNQFHENGDELQGYYGNGRGRKGRGRRGRRCEDKRNPFFCKWIADNHECNDKRMGRKCKKTCGYCKDQGCTDDRDNCNIFFKWHCDIPSILEQCRKFCGACDKENVTSTSAPTTTLTTAETTTLEEESVTTVGIENTNTTASALCVDVDEKNCKTWKSIGLCYSPKFKADMEFLCPQSCQFCSV